MRCQRMYEGVRYRQRQNERRSKHRAASFDDVDRQVPHWRRLACEAQWRRRRLFLRHRWAQHEDQSVAARRCQLQSAQMFVANLRKPAQQRAEAGAFQYLFGGPDTVVLLIRRDEKNVVQANAECMQRTCVRHTRRCQQDQCLAGLAQRRQGRREQAPFPDAGTGKQQFGQGRCRPAVAGKFAVERGIAGRYRLQAA